MKENNARTNLNTRKLLDSRAQRQILQYYPKLNQVLNMLVHQPEVKREELQLDILVEVNQHFISHIANFKAIF